MVMDKRKDSADKLTKFESRLQLINCSVSETNLHNLTFSQFLFIATIGMIRVSIS